jgi:hypothetical protein
VLDNVGRPSSRGRRRLCRSTFHRLTGIVVQFAFATAISMLLWGSPDIVVFGRDVADLLRRASSALPGSLTQLTDGRHPAHLAALVILALVPLRLCAMLITAAVRAWYNAARDRTSPGIAALRKQAKKQLDQIRFLQTYTTGWSGKLSMPLKGEAGRTWSTQRAEQQLTHPEVVDKFRELRRRPRGSLSRRSSPAWSSSRSTNSTRSVNRRKPTSSSTTSKLSSMFRAVCSSYPSPTTRSSTSRNAGSRCATPSTARSPR